MSKSKPIPETAGEMVKRARAGGAEVTEHLIESWCGMIGHVKIRKPGEPRAFLVIYVSEPRIMGKRRQVAYVESSGPIPQRSADRALRVVLRQMRDEREADELAAAELRVAELRQRDLGHGDILLHTDIGPSLLTCDGPDGCGATYADAMQHTQGEHDQRRRGAAIIDDVAAEQNARWRSYRAVRDRVEASLHRLQPQPVEIVEAIEAAWQRAMSAPGSDVPNQEIVMTALAAELQIRLDSLAADPHAGLTPSEIAESPARGCCGHVCKRLS